jgi:hypothetical protein
MEDMRTLKARVVKGRIVVDEPTDLPEGTELELLRADEFDDWSDLDDMDPSERARFEAQLKLSIEQADRGDLIPAEDVLAKLRTR